MPTSEVAGHVGRFVAGELGGVSVVAMQGRVHLYEGHAADLVVRGVRIMVALGARVLIVTNAAGGIASRLTPGTLMLIDDQLNLTGQNCLVGPNDDALGPRFPDMTHAYDKQLSLIALRVAAQQGVALARGVYAGLLGPAYETPAEVRMLRTLGADAVGMSTVLEVIAARHMGVRCLGVSCITNAAAGVSDDVLSHDDVQRVASGAAGRLQALITGVVAELGGAT
jgi:purine-nucleoside phosphorylase